LASAANVALAAEPAVKQDRPRFRGAIASLGAADLIELAERLGKPEPVAESRELVRQHAGSRRSGPGTVVAFEENRSFVYAAIDMSGNPPQQSTRRIRRVFLLKPSTLVIEDVISLKDPELPIRWMLRSSAEPKIDGGRFRVNVEGNEVLGETVFPANATLEKLARPAVGDRPAGFRVLVAAKQPAAEARFVHVLHLRPAGGQDVPQPAQLTGGDKINALTLSAQGKDFRLALPISPTAAGKIEIVAADGAAIVPPRLLPSGVMPHGPEGARLMERWDAPYRREGMPGWDVGRPSSYLVKAVEDGTFKPGRAIVFGCGTGTNAIFLAKRGFEVTGVDVAPSALAIAAEKAREAEVEVEWVLADVVAMPKLKSYDLIFDRGCYHHICQYDSPGFVKTLCALTDPGGRALILAGSPADGSRGGPPRIPEKKIRDDFTAAFTFEWLRNIHFESRNPEAKGPSAWSIHLRRKDSQ